MHTIRELSQNIYTVFNGLLIEIDVPTEFSGSMQTSFLRYISGYVCSHAFVDGVLLLAVPVLQRPVRALDKRLTIAPTAFSTEQSINPCLSGYHPHPLYVVCTHFPE